MSTSSPPADAKLWVALIHYPVLNRVRDVITTAITNLDVHDIARAARTYNLQRYFIVTPIERQRTLAARIVEHWCEGPGATRVPERGEALKLVETAECLEEVIARVTDQAGTPPVLVATCARPGRATVDFEGVRQRLGWGEPVLLLLGTGWGLADELLERADEVLAPIDIPGGDYNHLSVRSAATVMFDRLLADRG